MGRAMTADTMQKMADRVFEAVAGFVERKLAPVINRLGKMDQRLAVVDAKLAALEARTEVVYRGVWEQGSVYAEGSLCTDKGGMWFAERKTKARPGSPDSAWVLCVKRGNAPHARDDLV